MPATSSFNSDTCTLTELFKRGLGINPTADLDSPEFDANGNTITIDLTAPATLTAVHTDVTTIDPSADIDDPDFVLSSDSQPATDSGDLYGFPVTDFTIRAVASSLQPAF